MRRCAGVSIANEACAAARHRTHSGLKTRAAHRRTGGSEALPGAVSLFRLPRLDKPFPEAATAAL